MSDRTTIPLRFEDASYETVAVTVVGPNRYRLEATPVGALTPVYLGDLVEVEPRTDGTYDFRRVVEPGRMQHHAWVVPRGWFETADCSQFLATVDAADGMWETLMSGVLYVHVPDGRDFDVEAELDRYLSSEWPDA